MGGILDIHNHLNRSLNVAAFGADFSDLGNAGCLLKLSMKLPRRALVTASAAIRSMFWPLWLDRMHAPNTPEVECQVSNVIALFDLNVGDLVERISKAASPT
jgi:hypothetical protein